MTGKRPRRRLSRANKASLLKAARRLNGNGKTIDRWRKRDVVEALDWAESDRGASGKNQLGNILCDRYN